MKQRSRPNVNKIIRNVSQMLKIKQEDRIPVVPPMINNSVNFIRSSQRYTIFDSDLKLIKISHINKSFNSYKPMKKTPSPNASLSSSPMRDKHCEKLEKLISSIETFQHKNRIIKKTAIQEQISLKHKQKYSHNKKNQQILKNFHKNLLKVRKIDNY